ncbi:MAG TPA: hypothetical protein VFW00_10700 [Rhodocyclaceae bacterium]|nr:hypothetical protein [Rhodocyclaceae bacterium]
MDFLTVLASAGENVIDIAMARIELAKIAQRVVDFIKVPIE